MNVLAGICGLLLAVFVFMATGDFLSHMVRSIAFTCPEGTLMVRSWSAGPEMICVAGVPATKAK